MTNIVHQTTTNWFDNLTEEKVNKFDDFVSIINDSYIISSDIVTHSQERRRFVALILMLLRNSITEEKKAGRHQLSNVVEQAGGAGSLVLFFNDMKRYLREATTYCDWDEEEGVVKMANDFFPLIESSLKNSFALYYN